VPGPDGVLDVRDPFRGLVGELGVQLAEFFREPV
jgi:hypothetical protein